MITNKIIIFLDYSVNAREYLRSCEAFINSPYSGGIAFSEAYYAGLPIITEFSNNSNGCVTMDDISDMHPSRFFNNDYNVYPKKVNYDEMFTFTKNLIEDEKFRELVLNTRKIDSKKLTYEYFTKELIMFLNNL